ncbi:MAG: 50S ribosomal protein L9 [Methylococcales bacterium]|jgi:large subunit ribosomal protein L9|nr:50S ribosomal protein L9 [Methylococcales bacterium]MBT7409652.1 50S ribosomal protein L9 [Methylococcales bacterium]
MEVILLEKVENLGNLGDQVKVKSGFARNFLLPTKKATTASPENIEIFKKRKSELEKIAAQKIAEATTRADKLNVTSVVIPKKAGDEGKLFGSVGTAEIAEAATTAGVSIAKKEVKLPLGPLRETGDFEVAIHLHADVKASLKVSVVAES